jgi:hypothetical protein
VLAQLYQPYDSVQSFENFVKKKFQLAKMFFFLVLK